MGHPKLRIKMHSSTEQTCCLKRLLVFLRAQISLPFSNH